jgi:hypothetical protein
MFNPEGTRSAQAAAAYAADSNPAKRPREPSAPAPKKGNADQPAPEDAGVAAPPKRSHHKKAAPPNPMPNLESGWEREDGGGVRPITLMVGVDMRVRTDGPSPKFLLTVTPRREIYLNSLARKLGYYWPGEGTGGASIRAPAGRRPRRPARARPARTPRPSADSRAPPPHAQS